MWLMFPRRRRTHLERSVRTLGPASARLAVPLILLTLIFGVVSCGDDDSTNNNTSGNISKLANEPYQPGGTPVDGGTLKYQSAVPIESFNPWGVIQNGAIWAQQQVFDRLVEAAPDKLDPQPALADSWKVSADGLN